MHRSIVLLGAGLLLVGCRPHGAKPAPDAGGGDAFVDASVVVDAGAVVDAATAPERDAAACTPMRVLSVHTSVIFEIRITAFADALRAHGKTKSYTAFHPALELKDKGAASAKPTKHYLPACNFVAETGGVPCLDFDTCEEPAATDGPGLASRPMLACRGKAPLLFRWSERGDDLDVFQAKPTDTSWTPVTTLHPHGGCVAQQPGIVRVERNLSLNE